LYILSYYPVGAETYCAVCPFVQREGNIMLILVHATKRSSECSFQFTGQSVLSETSVHSSILITMKNIQSSLKKNKFK